MIDNDRIDALIKRIYQKHVYLLMSLFGPEYLLADKESKIVMGRKCIRDIFSGTFIDSHKKELLTKVFILDIMNITERKDLTFYLLHPDSNIRMAAQERIIELKAKGKNCDRELV